MILKNKFKIRCSAIGSIMAKPKKKEDLLSQGCLTYVYAWLKEQPEFYNRRVEFWSKQCDKGNLCEDDSIRFASDVYGWGFVQKNTESAENEYLTGTCDVQLADCIADIKNSYTQKTFPLFDTEIESDLYEWQLQGYMDLYNKSTASLIYTLMDAPTELVEREARWKMSDYDMDELEEWLFEEVRLSMSYSHLPIPLRIKSFDATRDRDRMLQVYTKVEQIRAFILSLPQPEWL